MTAFIQRISSLKLIFFTIFLTSLDYVRCSNFQHKDQLGHVFWCSFCGFYDKILWKTPYPSNRDFLDLNNPMRNDMINFSVKRKFDEVATDVLSQFVCLFTEIFFFLFQMGSGVGGDYKGAGAWFIAVPG